MSAVTSFRKPEVAGFNPAIDSFSYAFLDTRYQLPFLNNKNQGFLINGPFLRKNFTFSYVIETNGSISFLTSNLGKFFPTFLLKPIENYRLYVRQIVSEVLALNKPNFSFFNLKSLFFLYPNFSGSKKCISLRNTVHCIISFCDIHIEKMPARPISIDFRCFSNSLSCQNTSSYLPSR